MSRRMPRQNEILFCPLIIRRYKMNIFYTNNYKIFKVIKTELPSEKTVIDTYFGRAYYNHSMLEVEKIERSKEFDNNFCN